MNFKAKIVGGLTVAAILLLFVAALSYWDISRSAEDMRWVTHTHLVLEKLSDTQAGLVDAETGMRGFILTGEASYLQPYNGGAKRASASIGELRQLTADNPRQQRALDDLQPLVTSVLAVMEQHIDVRRDHGLTPGLASFQEDSGKALMDQIRSSISGMKAEENRLLVIRSEALERSSRQTKTAILTGDALAFLLLIAAGFVIQQEMGRRRQAENEVRSLNIELENRVAERTAQLAERAKELERSNMELQQFAYVASHDLQEPLRTISSFTQLLAKRYQDKLDDKAREFIAFAVDGCKRMQTLINDLLSLSRVGTQGRDLVPVRCEEVMDRVLKSMRQTIEDADAIITRSSLPLVLADEVQLSQLFQNLLGNAIKFKAGDAPRIHISAERNGAGWKFQVRDNGIGISPEHAERIFVIFQRLHNKSQYPGTGIGLAICKKIAERHGGRIWVDSAPGGGSIFSFTMNDGGQAVSRENKKESEDELRTHAAGR